MSNYEHNKLVEQIAALSRPPADAGDLDVWVEARSHLQLLEDNTQESELIVAARDDTTSIQSVVVREDKLHPLDEKDLLGWQGNGFEPRAQFMRRADQDDVQIEESRDLWMSRTLAGAQPLTFGRHAKGFGDDGGAYYEVLQEYVHVFDVHWQSNEKAYCDFDEHGDLRHVVSITLRKDGREADLVSFRREQLEQYLTVTDSVLVRMFDFELVPDYSSIDKWPDLSEVMVRQGETLFARKQANSDVGCFVRGVQIVRPSHSKAEVFGRPGPAQGTRSKVAFTAYDWRSKRTIEISTNFSEAEDISRPFELSMVCFRPEVLLRYKGDRDKYTVDERFRTITCRSGWQIKYDTNEAGQVFVYFIRLEPLPYQEQLYWKSFNENPRAELPERAFNRDFAGMGADSASVVRMQGILEEWDAANVPWWKLRNKRLFLHVSVPHAGSRDEWAQAFEDLAKLVVEGFETSVIHERLTDIGIIFGKHEKSIALLEKLVFGPDDVAGGEQLSGFRSANYIRNKVAVHVPGQEAEEIENKARQSHGTFAAHFQSVCADVADDLAKVKEAFARRPPS